MADSAARQATGIRATREERLHAALIDGAAPVSVLGPASWRFRVPGHRRIGNARLGDDWLQLYAPLDARRAGSSMQRVRALLERNASLPADVRIVQDGDASSGLASAEIPVDETLPDDDLEAAIERALHGLSCALRSRAAKADTAIAWTRPDGLEKELTDLGWRCQDSEQELVARLDVPTGYHPATIEQHDDAIRLRTPLGPPASRIAERCRDAVALLAWRCSSRLRLVKAVRADGSLHFEIVLGSGHTRAIDDGLAALSLVLRQCAAEAAVLASDTKISTSYLAMQGFSVP